MVDTKLSNKEIYERFKAELLTMPYGSALLDTGIVTESSIVLYVSKYFDPRNCYNHYRVYQVESLKKGFDETRYCFEILLAMHLSDIQADFFAKHYREIPSDVWKLFFDNHCSLARINMKGIFQLLDSGFFGKDFLVSVFGTAHAFSSASFIPVAIEREFIKDTNKMALMFEHCHGYDERLGYLPHWYLDITYISFFSKNHITLLIKFMKDRVLVVECAYKLSDLFFELVSKYQKLNKDSLFDLINSFVDDLKPVCDSLNYDFSNSLRLHSENLLQVLVCLGDMDLLTKFIGLNFIDYRKDRVVLSLLESPDLYNMLRKHYMLQKLV